MLIPKNPENPVELALRVQTKFLLECDQSIDVLVYRDTEFYREVLKNAKEFLLKSFEEYPLAWTNIPFRDTYPRLGFRD